MTFATPSTSRPPQPPSAPLFRTAPAHSPPHPSASAAARSSTSRGQSMAPLVTPNPAVSAAYLDGSGTRIHSPNYFGLSLNTKDGFSSSAAQHARANWSPPTSQVRSTAAASPRIIPLEHNPEFDAFRRASEAANNFDFGLLSNFSMVGRKENRPVINRSSSHASTVGNDMPPPSPKTSSSGSLSSLNETQKSPKRLLSSPSPNLTDRPRRNSPASFSERPDADQVAQFLDDRSTSRMSLPAQVGGSSATAAPRRSETLPLVASNGTGDKIDRIEFVSPQHVVGILETLSEDVLLLDLRVSTQYLRGRIRGALNLCIPTTLLKRPSFNLAKLLDTFKDEEQKFKFQSWSDCKYIIVYDANSAQSKDAVICTHTLRKFINEGWTGPCYIVRGGFHEFSKTFPSFVTAVDARSGSMSSSASDSDSSLPSVAPVAGGCPMPVTKSAANPFFGNIRQNMDLIGGVGQMPIKRPSALTPQLDAELPQWLKRASGEADDGHNVSNKFLQIERREQQRMQEALSGNITYGTPGSAKDVGVQIAGIEKGAKNRYNNIWPYEHSRVKLQGVPHGGCDYINANHVKSKMSNKRYIATQSPIPATFADFWNTVWQQDIRVIMMLTAEEEGGQVKAHNYWEARSYGPLKLQYLSEHRASLELDKIHRHKERLASAGSRGTNPVNAKPTDTELVLSPNSEHPYVIVRRFTLSHADQPFERMREITQLQYSHWPDFGAPAHPAHLLALVEQCDSVVRASTHSHFSNPDPPGLRPVLVHCSAGCGRTGTFCTVDTVIDILKRQHLSKVVLTESTPSGPSTNRKGNAVLNGHLLPNLQGDEMDLIEKTVEEFRLQRLSMVQSLRQYVLCYESVLEWIVEQQAHRA